MRAVERVPWGGRRSSMHDKICAMIATDPGALMHFLTDGAHMIDCVDVEAPCGRGFCDILIQTHGRTIAWFVEVKTDAEDCSAGDLIRQLRWYASQRNGFERKRLVCVTQATSHPRSFETLLAKAGVSLVPSPVIWDISRCNPRAWDSKEVG